MGSKSIKYEVTLSNEQAAPLMEAMKATFTVSAEGAAAPDFETMKKAKCSMKRHEGGITVKMKIKLADPESEGDEGDDDDEDEGCEGDAEEDPSGGAPEDALGARKSGYKKLKKRMKADFAGITGALAAERMPDGAVAGRFIEDSRIMCTFGGRGDKHYGPYLAACDDFGRACADGDLAGASSAVARIAGIKGICHEECK